MAETALKIALLGPAPPFRGGISQFALMLAKEYQRSGNSVKMFTFQRQYPKLLFPGGEQTTEFSDLPDVQIERVFTPYIYRSWNRAVERIREYQPDLVIVSYFLPWFAPSYAWICKRLQGTRIICLAHNIDFHEKWPCADALTRRLFKHCDRIVLLSEACYKDLQRKMPAAISAKGVQGFHPIYDCYGEESSAAELSPQEEKTLLFFGLIKPYKGLDVLLKALKQVQKRISGVRLIIAGEVYGKPNPYLELIRTLGLGDSVETQFRYITDKEIAGIFQRSQVCILPYKSATQSGVIATSYNFNLPVIASDVGGLSEYIEEGVTGMLVPPNDPEALAAAIIRYFEADLYSVMSRNIPAYKERYSWPRLAEIILQA